MLPKNKQELEKIRKECRSMVDNSSLISGGAAIIPVPGLDIASDVGLLLDLLPKINRSFGLSPEQIDALDSQTKAYVVALIISMGTQLVGQVLTKQLIMQVLKSVGIRMTAKQVVKYIPFLGQAAAAGLSFAAMQYVLPYLEEEVVKRINEQFSNFNGMELEELVLKYGKTKLTQKLGAGIFNEGRVNTLLKLANTGVNKFERLRNVKNKLDLGCINARVSQGHLWLSIV